MFRGKGCTVASRSLLRAKEVKALREQMEGSLSLTGGELSALLPKGEVECIRFGGSKWPAYGRAASGQPPLCFVIDDRTDRVAPTVFTLWAHPRCLPIVLVHAAVSEYLCAGADVMLPGVMSAPAEYHVGDLVAVQAAGNPAPFAVAMCLVSAMDAAAAGMRGKGFRVLHIYKDALWVLGGSFIPNEGYVAAGVLPLPAAGASEAAPDVGTGARASRGAGDGIPDATASTDDVAVIVEAREHDANAAGSWPALGEEESAAGEPVPVPAKTVTCGGSADGDGHCDGDARGASSGGGGRGGSGDVGGGDGGSSAEGGGGDVGGGGGGGSSAEGGGGCGGCAEGSGGGEARGPLTFAELSPDEQVIAVFFQALRTRVKDKDLPMLASHFYATHMLPARPAGTSVDLKRSSFKKLAGLLQAMKARHIIQFADKSGVVSVTAVNRSNPELRAFVPWRLDGGAPGASDVAGAATVDGSVVAGMKSVAKPVGTLDILDVVRPAASLAPVLDAVADAARAAGREPPGYRVTKGSRRGGEEVLYTRAEVAAGVAEYVRLRGLGDPGDATRVVLDAALADALFRGAKKGAAGGGHPRDVSKQEAVAAALAQCAPWHIVRCGDVAIGHAGVVEAIEVVVKALQGGKKHMTFVRNCQLFGIDAADFARDSSKLYACSASTQASESHSDMEDAQIQGDVGEEVVDRLVREFRIPKRYVSLKKAKR